jgi:hypothetical protein
MRTFEAQPVKITWHDTQAVEHFEGYNAAAKALNMQGSSLQSRLATGGGSHTFTVRKAGELPRIATATKLPLNKIVARAKALGDPNREPTDAELKLHGSHSVFYANRNTSEKAWVNEFRAQVEARRKAMGYTPPTRAERKVAVAKAKAIFEAHPFLRDELPSLVAEGRPPKPSKA